MKIYLLLILIALAVAGTMDYEDEKAMETFSDEYQVIILDEVPDPVLVPVEQVRDYGTHTDTVRDL